MKTFPAKYSGLCIPCGEEIQRDDEITHHEVVGYVHVHCINDADAEAPGLPRERRSPATRAVDVMPRGKTVRDRCDRCFLVHTAAQGGECE